MFPPPVLTRSGLEGQHLVPDTISTGNTSSPTFLSKIKDSILSYYTKLRQFAKKFAYNL